MILDPNSLIKTIDNINQQFLLGNAITQEEGLEASRWIISRQGGKGSYRDMSAPTQPDFERGIRLFTGERLISASARHIMGQEAARAVWILGNTEPVVQNAYERSIGWMHENPGFQETGKFCCGRCTLGFWRHFWIGNLQKKSG